MPETLTRTKPEEQKLLAEWSAQWQNALALWSRFTKLSEPRWCFNLAEEKAEGLEGSFAMIRLDDHAVVISLRQVRERGLEKFAPEIMAHEIGHHVYAPADLTDHGRMMARIRKALPTKEHLAPFVANLYTDLLVNDRLQRSANLQMADLYRFIGKGSSDRMWTFYMRLYEILWSFSKGSLAEGKIDETLEGDAQLGSRVIRAYARDWLDGAGRFAALCLPYLIEDEGRETRKLLSGWLDTEKAGEGGNPGGLAEIEGEEEEGAIHPSMDEELSGVGDEEKEEKEKEESKEPSAGENKAGSTKPQKRYREPSEFGELLKNIGVKADESEVAIRYYRERALPYLVEFPVRTLPESTEPLPEGLEGWDFGQALDQVDWFESVMQSPVVVPGQTTVQRTYGTMAGTIPQKEPVDLYLGVDCSGSMINPRYTMSYPVLAGAIIALSALRAGARVQVVLSGAPGKMAPTDGFVTDEKKILGVLTDYLGTGYAFGIHLLHDVFSKRKKMDRPVHILIVTDHDIFTMLREKNKNENGWEVAKAALEGARGGGTFVLHMDLAWAQDQVKLLNKDGWNVHCVRVWDDILAFAREFSREHYEAKTKTDT